MSQDDASDTIIQQPPDTADPGQTQIAPPQAEKTAIVAPEAGATLVVTPVVCPVCNATSPAGEIYCVDCGFLLSSAPGEGVEVRPVEDLIRLVNVQDENQVSPLHAGTNSVGREDADVLLIDATVSRKHATITVDGDTITLTDTGSTNGTTVNGAMLAANQPRTLRANDEIAFGRVTFRLIVPGVEPGPPEVSEPEPEPIPEGAYARLMLSGPPAATHYLTADEFRIGRREGDLILRDSYCSGRHALIRRAEGEVTITDLGSTNGTLVNGEKIAVNEPVALKDGDQITIGQTVITFSLITAEPTAESEGPPEPEATAQERLPEQDATALDSTAQERLPEPGAEPEAGNG
jgi:pSer/pThr/pTyr-binding forkhead associated (FHA) protein